MKVALLWPAERDETMRPRGTAGSRAAVPPSAARQTRARCGDGILGSLEKFVSLIGITIISVAWAGVVQQYYNFVLQLCRCYMSAT